MTLSDLLTMSAEVRVWQSTYPDFPSSLVSSSTRGSRSAVITSLLAQDPGDQFMPPSCLWSELPFHSFREKKVVHQWTVG